MNWAVLALALFAAPANAGVPWAGISVVPRNPTQGEVISIGFDKLPKPSEYSVFLDGKETPVYRVSRSRARAMVPTTPNHTVGRQILRITRGGVLGKTSWRIKINVRKGSYREKKLNVDEKPWEDSKDPEMRAAKARMRRTLQFKTQKQLFRGAWKRPTRGRLTGIYGNRRIYNGTPSESYHRGSDYAGKRGVGVVAANSGRVVYTEKAAFEGNTVLIDHGQGVLSLYIHLSKFLVKKGDLVAWGQSIGRIGMTGRATGPHLHFGIYVDGQAVNPVPFLNRRF